MNSSTQYGMRLNCHSLFSNFQSRFFISPSTQPTDQVWPLPLTFTTGNNPDWNKLTPSHVMWNKTMEIQKEPGQEWVIFNIQQKG